MQKSIDLRWFIDKVNANAEAIVRTVVIEIGVRIVARSPVGDPTKWKTKYPPKGYVGGRFRANWQYGNGRSPEGVLPDIDASGAVSIDRIVGGVGNSPAFSRHFITNNLPYAEELERGHSQQAPAGMVGLVVQEFQQIVDDAAGAVKK